MIDIKSSRISIFLSNVSQFSSFYEARKVFLQVIMILTLVSFPVKAFSQCNASGDIPFDVSNSATFGFCVICDGPWLRTSGLFRVPSGTEDCEFYAANKTAFSPFGKWTCKLFNTDPHNDTACDDTDSGFITQTEFCVEYAPPDADNTVGLFIENDKLSTNQSAPPCSGSVSSFLGDNTKQEKSRPDTDVFTFDGTGGDQVTLRLETNPQEGNNGGEASLGISGNSLNESTSGTPPLELNVNLPGDGEYSLTVEQPQNSALRFRGSYILRVTPSIGSIDLIEPTNNVEK